MYSLEVPLHEGKAPLVHLVEERLHVAPLVVDDVDHGIARVRAATLAVLILLEGYNSIKVIEEYRGPHLTSGTDSAHDCEHFEG